ncbi:MAG: TolC family protein [Phycisphaerae bacterium]
MSIRARLKGLAAAGAVLGSMLLASCDAGGGRFMDYIGPTDPDKGPTATISPAQSPGPDYGPGPAPTTGPATTSAPTTISAPSGTELKISIAEAILMALENNKSLIVDRFNTPITRTTEEVARAAFDPLVTGQASWKYQRVPSGPRASFANVQTTASQLGVSEFLPIGMTIALQWNTFGTDPSSAVSDTNNFELSVTQSLLRGAGLDVNLATLRQARLDTLSSQYELRGLAESIVAKTEEAYWAYALAARQVTIFEAAEQLAQQQLDETLQRIKVGKLADTEAAAARAQLALSHQSTITARNAMLVARIAVLRLVSPPGSDIWQRQVVLTDAPEAPGIFLEDVERHVQVALRLRTDLNQARLLVQRGELEIVKTSNGLLPRLDLFINLGKTGYADSFGRSFEELDGQGYMAQVGVSGDWSPINRSARALDTRAHLTRDQSMASVDNLAQLVQVDVRAAYVVVINAREQIDATAQTVKYQQVTYDAEVEKYRQGKSTSLLVATAQQNLTSAQISHIQAIVAYLNGLVELYRLDGSLLIRRGITAPGAKPVVLKGDTSY